MELKNIRIEFTRPNSHPFPIISFIIRLTTWFKASHALLVFPERFIIFHVYFNKWLIETEDQKSAKHEVVYAYDLFMDYTYYYKIIEQCANDNGKKTFGYYLQLISCLITMPFRIFGIYLGSPFTGFINSNLCSEYVMRLLLSKFDLKSFLSLEWENRSKALSTFNEKELKQFLDYLVDLQRRDVKLPLKIRKVEV